MRIHTMIFYGIVTLMAVIYIAIGNMFRKLDINTFYFILTGIVVLGYGQYVKYNNAGDSRKKKLLVIACAVLAVIDMGVCAYYMPKITYNHGQQIIEARYDEADKGVPVTLDFPQFFYWGEYKFNKGCYEYFYDVEGDLHVYLFNQYTGESFLGRIVEDYNRETAVEKIIQEDCIILEPEIIGGAE